jgi:hypothetical protein
MTVRLSNRNDSTMRIGLKFIAPALAAGAAAVAIAAAPTAAADTQQGAADQRRALKLATTPSLSVRMRNSAWFVGITTGWSQVSIDSS